MRKTLVLMAAAVMVFAACNKKNAQPAEAVPAPAAPKAQLDLIVITSDAHAVGGEDYMLTEAMKNVLNADFNKTVTDYKEFKGKEEWKGLDLSFMPVYLIKSHDALTEKFGQHIQSGVLPVINGYLVFTHQTRNGVFVDKKQQKNLLELFVMSQCGYGTMAEQKIIDAKKAGKFPKNVNVKLRYIVQDLGNGKFSSLHGSAEWEENVRQIIVQKNYPSKFWKYLEIRNKDFRSSLWDDALSAAGIDPASVKKSFNQGKKWLAEDAAYGAEVNANASPTFLWEGRILLDGARVATIPGLEFFNAQSQAAPAITDAGC